jgi:hypothetical protein
MQGGDILLDNWYLSQRREQSAPLPTTQVQGEHSANVTGVGYCPHTGKFTSTPKQLVEKVA